MRPPRISIQNGLYHIVTRCNNKEFHFANNEDFEEYLAILDKARSKHGIKIHAYCLTANHTHLMISTPRNNISQAMHYINGQYARNYNRRHGRVGHFWGQRFHSTVIESETQFLNCLHYIELNMVRCGVVRNPSEWIWSSYNQHASGKGIFVVDFHEMYIKLGNTAKKRERKYVQMMKDRIKEKGLLKKQPQISDGLIYGPKDFVENILSQYDSCNYYRKSKQFKISGDVYCIKKMKQSAKSYDVVLE